MPKISGSGTGELELPPPQVVFRKTNCSIATAAASVTTARLTPRTRSAETATMSPHTVATSAPISIAQGEADAVIGREVGDG